MTYADRVGRSTATKTQQIRPARRERPSLSWDSSKERTVAEGIDPQVPGVLKTGGVTDDPVRDRRKGSLPRAIDGQTSCWGSWPTAMRHVGPMFGPSGIRRATVARLG